MYLKNEIRFFWNGLLFLCLVGMQGELCAQGRFDSVQKLKEVQITSSSSKKNISTLLPRQEFGSTELQRMSSRQLSDVVKLFAGVNVKDYGGVGGMKTVSVRSLGAAHTAVSYDGVLLSDAQNGQIDLGKISLEKIQSVALTNGQSASIFESARSFASAALLNIETRSMEDMDTAGIFKLGFTAGSFSLLSPSLSYEKKITKLLWVGLHARYDYVYGNYPFILNFGGSEEKLKRQNTQVQSGNLEANLKFLLSPSQVLDMKLYYYGSERGLPGAVIYYSPTSKQRLSDQNFFMQFKHHWQISPCFVQKNFLKYNFSYNRFLDPQSLNATSVQDDRYRQQEIYLSTVTLFSPKVKGLSFSASLDLAFNFLDANWKDFVYPMRSSLWFNVAGKYKHPYFELMSNGLLSAFFDRVRFGSSPKDKIKFSPFVSLAITPLGNNSLAFRFFYKDIFRMPTFNDLYYSRMGNVSLLPEKAQQVDAGISYVYRPLRATLFSMEVNADFYRNWVKDKIVAYPTRNLFIWSMMNVGKVEVTGIDVALKIGLAFGGKSLSSRHLISPSLASRFRIDAWGSYTFQRSLDKTNVKDATYNHQIAYTPVHSSTAGISLSMPYVSISYQLTYSGERYALNENIPENLMKPYFDHSLSLKTDFKIYKVLCEIGVDFLNITGAQYEIVRYYPMPLFNYRAYIRCKF
ncbi:MAG: TonB-dependent receptor plug domain-containing protein [Bacteroidales bacterium]